MPFGTSPPLSALTPSRAPVREGPPGTPATTRPMREGQEDVLKGPSSHPVIEGKGQEMAGATP